eukprot:9252772-Pyramimonas_sp.AAC.1
MFHTVEAHIYFNDRIVRVSTSWHPHVQHRTSIVDDMGPQADPSAPAGVTRPAAGRAEGPRGRLACPSPRRLRRRLLSHRALFRPAVSGP